MAAEAEVVGAEVVGAEVIEAEVIEAGAEVTGITTWPFHTFFFCCRGRTKDTVYTAYI